MEIIDVKINNYMSLFDVAFSPSKFTVLLGKNGSGKTNIVEALNRFFNDLAISGGGVPSGFTDYFWFDRDLTNPIRIEVTIKLNEKEVNDIFSLPKTIRQIFKKKFGENYFIISIVRQLVDLSTGWKTEFIKWNDLQLVFENKVIDSSKINEFLTSEDFKNNFKMYFFTQDNLGGPRLLVDLNNKIAYYSNPQIDSLVVTNILSTSEETYGKDFKTWASEQGLTLYERPPNTEEVSFLIETITQDDLQSMLNNLVNALKGKFRYISASRDVLSTPGIRSSLIDNRVLESLRTLFISLARSDQRKRDKFSNWVESFIGKRLEPNPAQVLAQDRTLHLPLHYLGGGEQELALLMWNLLDPQIITVIEEPEIHFHPEYSRKFLQFLKGTLCDQSQVIITTHSPTLIDKSDIENNWWVRKGVQGTEIQRIDSRETLKLALSELGMIPSDLYLKDYVLFVEGGTEKEAVIPIFANKLGLMNVEELVAIISVGGDPHIRDYLKIWLELLNYYPVEYAIILDKHSEQLVYDLIRDEKFDITMDRFYILEKGSIEDYYPVSIVESALSALFGIADAKIHLDKPIAKQIQKILEKEKKIRNRWKVDLGEYVSEQMTEEIIPEEVKTVIKKIQQHLS